MKLALLIFLGICAASASTAEDAQSATVLVVRIGDLSEQGMQLASGRHFDEIGCDIISPEDFRSIEAYLVLVPSPANKRFAKEKGHYAKLLLRETDLKERLRCGSSILIPSSLPTAEKPDSLVQATPVSMRLPEEEETPNPARGQRR